MIWKECLLSRSSYDNAMSNYYALQKEEHWSHKAVIKYTTDRVQREYPKLSLLYGFFMLFLLILQKFAPGFERAALWDRILSKALVVGTVQYLIVTGAFIRLIRKLKDENYARKIYERMPWVIAKIPGYYITLRPSILKRYAQNLSADERHEEDIRARWTMCRRCGLAADPLARMIRSWAWHYRDFWYAVMYSAAVEEIIEDQEAVGNPSLFSDSPAIVSYMITGKEKIY